jgi:prevent-host-death family protein
LVGVTSVIALRDLRNDISAILRRVEAGEQFTVTVRGRPVAELGPVRGPRRFVPRDELGWVFALPADRAYADELEALDVDEDAEGLTRVERLYDPGGDRNVR